MPLDQYSMIGTTSKNKNNFGRQIKGINLYHKTENTVIKDIISENGDIIIVEMKNKQWKEVEKIHMIICYRESRESKYADKNYFDKIKEYIEKFKMKHIIMLGDLNSRIGKMNDNKHLNLPKRNSEDSIVNKQGRELINFCNETSLIIANGRYEKGQHTFCRLQNEKCYKSVIDYLLLTNSMVKYLEAFKIMEPKLYTDHRPLKIDFKIALKSKMPKTVNIISRSQRNDNGKRVIPFKWKTKCNSDKYRQTITNKSSKLLEEVKDKQLSKSEIYDRLVKVNKESIKATVASTTEIIYSDDTRCLRRKYKQNVDAYKTDQSELNLSLLLQSKRELGKNIKREKRNLQRIKLNELQIAKANKDVKNYWELLNNNNKPKKNSKQKTALNAEIFKENMKKRDNEIKIVNDKRITSDIVNQIIPNRNDDELNKNFTIAEVENAIKYSKNSKSSGPDEMVYEMLKNDQNQTQILYTLFNQIMSEGNVPWHSSWITPIFKKGDKNDSNSYRCINLSSCIEKLLTRMLNDRLNDWIDKFEILHESQTGFRKGHSTIDNIWVLKEIIQIYKNDNKTLYTCFVDLSKAFDTVQKSRLINKLRYIIPNGNFLSLIENIINNKRYKILFNGEESEELQLNYGIPQGDSLSPTLFCIYMNDFLIELNKNISAFDPAKITNINLAALIYADDILLLSESQVGIVEQIKFLHKFCENNSLKINYNKTKIMIFNGKNKYEKLILDDGNMFPIDVVDVYRYLGVSIARTDRMHIEELTKRGRASSYVTAKTLKEFNTDDGRILTEALEMLTISRMRYGSEIFFDRNINDLNRVIMQFYKRYYHLRITTPNYCIIGEFGVKPIEYYFYKSALNYFLKLNMSDDKRLITRLFRTINKNTDKKSFRNTWCSRIDKLVHKIDLKNIQSMEYSGKSKKIIDNALIEYFRREWIDSAKHSVKGLRYLELCRFQCQLKPYLAISNSRNKICSVIKLRTGNHTLAAEVGTYQNRSTYKDCICKFCDLNKIEDIFHFIVECPCYNDERDALIPDLRGITRSDFYVYMDALTIGKIRPVDEYIDRAMDIRNHR